MQKRYSGSEDKSLNLIIIICAAAVLLATAACVLVQRLTADAPETPENDLGVLITSTDFPSSEPSATDASATDVPETTTAAATTTTSAAPEQNVGGAYDITLKDSDAVRSVLTQIMSPADLALMDNIIATGSNIASASSPESTYDLNGSLIIVDAEMQAIKYEYYVQGAGERVILLCAADGRVYVGLVTGSQMHYYTNDDARRQTAPKCISGYAQALSLEMMYLSA